MDEEGEPGFSGPFAAEYLDAWRKSTSGDVRRIIADELITDQEWSSVVESLKRCLSAKGIALEEYNDDGSYSAVTGDIEDSRELMVSCEKESGEAWLSWLYRSQSSNPDNIPESLLITDCLVRSGAVPPDYTEEDYLADAPTFSFPFIDERGPDIFVECNTNSGDTLG